MQSQFGKPWSDVGNTGLWLDENVELILPGSGDKAATIQRITAKRFLLNWTKPGGKQPELISIVAVSNPFRKETCIFPYGRYFVSHSSSTMGLSLEFGESLHRSDCMVHVPLANDEHNAIQQFAADFTPELLVHKSRRLTTVRFSRFAPKEFYVRGSQLVRAELLSIDMRDGTLKLEMKSYSGAVGVFWVDVEKFAVVKTEFQSQ